MKLTEPEPAAAEQDELLKRIVYNPQILSGKAIIRGHRMSVSNVLGMLANGATPAELLAEYEWLEADDIRACLLYAAEQTDRDRFMPAFYDEPVAK